MSTIKIKPSHPSQGEYVLIEAADFNPEIHERIGEPGKRDEAPKRDLLRKKR